MQQAVNPTPHVYKELYLDQVDGYFFAYNPLSTKGVIILTDELRYMLSVINGKTGLNKILTLLSQRFISFTPDRLKYLITLLVKSEFVYFGKPQLLNRINKSKPDTFAVWLHVTNQCNLRCTYCFVPKSNEEMDEKTMKITVEKLFASASLNKYKTVFIQFEGGEPLLKLKRIVPAAQLAKDLGKKYKIDVDLEIITNGVLLTKNAVTLLEQLDIYTTISIDGLSNKHNAARPFTNGDSSIDYVSKGIENIRKSRIFKGVIVTITGHNVKSLPEMTKYFLSKNIRFSFQFFTENPQVKPEDADKLRVDDKTLISYLKKTYQIIRAYLPQHKLFNGMIHTIHLDQPVPTCPAANHIYMAVRQDGQIANCNWLLEKPIGSVHDSGDMITAFRKNAFIKPVSSLGKKIECIDCQWRYVCSGCPLDFYWNKKIKAPPYCKVKKTLIPEVLKLEAARIIKYVIIPSINKQEKSPQP